jgi:hypothetical protein
VASSAVALLLTPITVAVMAKLATTKAVAAAQILTFNDKRLPQPWEAMEGAGKASFMTTSFQVFLGDSNQCEDTSHQACPDTFHGRHARQKHPQVVSR